MQYHYKALFSDPGCADLVYAKLKQQYPQLTIHISESDYQQDPHPMPHWVDHTDTEFGSETSFVLLAPLSANYLTPAEQLSQNTTGITPSPYGAIQSLLDPPKTYPDLSYNAVVYGSCQGELKTALSQNLRNYGAQTILFSRSVF